MIIPTFIVVFLLLGKTQAQSDTFEVEPNQNFEKTFDPGFVVKPDTVKLDGQPLAECSQKSEDCYSQILKSQVKFMIADKNKCEKVQFTHKDNVLVTYKFDEKGDFVEDKPPAVGSKSKSDGVTDNKFEKANFSLDCQPDGMQIIKKAEKPAPGPQPAPGPSQSDQTNSEQIAAVNGEGQQNPETVPVKEKCSTTPAPTGNCFEVLKNMYPVTVKAKMASTERTLKIEENGAVKAEVIFKPKSGGSSESTTSAANLMPRWAAVILANAAIMYLFY